ncbi:melanin-concentrating hormone receptor 2 isoform X5 [Gallus gallus]|uniref:melanin-concentrating hormone receptor 2 isoform X5 n=1 Tax=Gallus gallus TaxID=9031 RepID=UPI001F00003E|nr:melanin-concentrating hormone receptor 2 isoform X5 [Gallus gallus]
MSVSQPNRSSSTSPVSHLSPCVATGSSSARRRMMEHEDFTSLAGYWNSSDSYQFSPASVIVPVVFSLIFLLGTVGNSLVLAVLLRNRQMGHNTTNLFILNLSLADFFFIVFCVPFQATIYSLEGWVFGSFICKAVHFFIYLTMYASSFTLAAVSVDRYLAIRYPLRSRELRTPYNAVAAMAVIWGLSVVFAGPYLSYYDLIEWESSYICMPGWEEWRRKVMDTSTFAFGYVIPVLVISLSYTRTIKYLWTAVEPLEDMSESKKAKRKATYAFRLLSHCMAYANSCLNPIVYALVSKHFRKGFKRVFSCLLRKKHRNKVHVLHAAHTVPGFEAGSTEVSQVHEENNRCELNPDSLAVPSGSSKHLHLS